MTLASGEQAPIAEAMAMNPTVELRGISKWFGSVVAVNDVSFQI